MRFKNPFAKEKEDSVIEVIELLLTINNRKQKHLHDCIQAICTSAKVPYVAPKTFLTDYELEILNRMRGEKADRIKRLVLKSFDEIEIEK